MKVPLAAIFREGVRLNTITGCWWLMSAFTVYSATPNNNRFRSLPIFYPHGAIPAKPGRRQVVGRARRLTRVGLGCVRAGRDNGFGAADGAMWA